ncbi:glycoside hydrolase family 3 N-terminal domain-containing protein [Ferdinandcohnia quinoae]|uniref:beta-glucosidase n=1 Tax=Fredinandcohnia quinoae TaxID=2918902 RepID=A0AAW5E2P8_9BACI|nr:glycoside hydrolase family 3 N-terminal domain-containing protein [Fredinandcohnia sp. SECRCQ15]MCH1624357.1 glycoside hydrolase family 3 C-terminal domain-containing protein [Fredinandcohnia sp. SECRCQ15]
MIGTWSAPLQTSVAKINLTFLIEKNESYHVTVKTEPLPLNIVIQDVKVEGNKLLATGIFMVFEEKELEMELLFSEDTFSGNMNLGTLGKLHFEGVKGEDNSLSEKLLKEVQTYRQSRQIQERTEAEIHEEIDKLLNKMTLTEKIGQMSQCQASQFSFGGEVDSDPPEQLIAEGKAGSVLGAFDIHKVFELQKIAVEKSRLGIPLFFNADVIHGYQTIFPVPLAWSSSWDMEAVKRACAISAKEAAASGITYNHGPMVDVTRDPRWGRVVEGAGEDPYLGSLMASAMVEGFQGESLANEETLIACLKHFVAYGAAEGGRDYNTVDISEGTMRNVYLPPFIAGLKANAASVMNAFNIFQGIPVAGNKSLMQDLLRDELGFDGMVITDYGSIDELVIHGIAKDNKEAAKLAVDAALDIEMVTTSYSKHLPSLIGEGRVNEEQLDEAVRRILYYKYKIGIMDDPFRYIRPDFEEKYHYCNEHLEESRELAKKSIVLLKNDGVLPFQKDHGKVAIIGPFANSKDLLGPWQFSKYGNETITLLDGIIGKVHHRSKLLHAEGCKVDNEIVGGFEEAVRLAQQAEVIILALGESSGMSGEAASRMSLELPSIQKQLAEEIVKLGKPTILVLTNGRPLVLDWFDKNMNAIVETWFLGSQAGHAIADVLYGDYNPAGKLTMSFPYTTGQVPVYYNHYTTGRPLTTMNQQEKFISKYLDGPNEPLYPFGYGLNYTTFSYSEIELTKKVMSRNESISASVTIINTGNFAGEEVVQLYIQDLYGSVVRPVKELKGFKKIYLQSGESMEVTFTITENDLKYFAADNSYKAETGEFKLYIGTNSRDVKEVGFELID